MADLINVVLLVVFGFKIIQIKAEIDTILQRMCQTVCEEDRHCKTLNFDTILSCCERSLKHYGKFKDTITSNNGFARRGKGRGKFKDTIESNNKVARRGKGRFKLKDTIDSNNKVARRGKGRFKLKDTIDSNNGVERRGKGRFKLKDTIDSNNGVERRGKGRFKLKDTIESNNGVAERGNGRGKLRGTIEHNSEDGIKLKKHKHTGFLMRISSGMFYVNTAFKKRKMAIRGLKGSRSKMLFSFDREKIYALSEVQLQVGVFTPSAINFNTHRYIKALNDKVLYKLVVDGRNTMLAVKVKYKQRSTFTVKVFNIDSDTPRITAAIGTKDFSVDKMKRRIYYTSRSNILASVDYTGHNFKMFREVEVETQYPLQTIGQTIFWYICMPGSVVKHSFKRNSREQQSSTFTHIHRCKAISHVVNIEEKCIGIHAPGNDNQTMSSFPTCQVCHQQFSQKGPAPFLLPCLHVVCEVCVTSAAGGMISCSPCQRDVNLTETSLQKDVITEKEILHLTVKHNPELVLCTHEEEGNQAVCWCKECEDFLCENCQMTHGRLKITRQHVVEDLGDLQPDSFDVDDYCKVHPKSVLDTWDEECCVLICAKCKLGDHAEHKTFDIDEAAETTKREMADLKDEIKASVTQQRTHLTTMDRDLQASDETCGLLTEEISHTFNTLKIPLEQREKELQVELQQHREEVRRGLLDEKNISEACQKKCQRASDYIRKTLQYSSRHDIMSLRQILQSKSREFIGSSRSIVYESPQLPCFYTDGLEKIKSALVEFGAVARKDDQTAANRTIDFGIQTDDWVSGELDMAKKEVMQLKAQHKKEIQSLRETFKREKELERKGTRVEFSKTKFNEKYVHINSEGELVNRKGSSLPYSHGRLKKYAGTSSTVPLPLDGDRQYFEVKTRVDIDRTLTKNNLLFEIGFTTEEKRDEYPFVAKYDGCYSLTVQHCTEHDSICRKIWINGDDIQCVPDTLENVPGATATFHYGVVYNTVNSYIGFIDVDNEIVIGPNVFVYGTSALWPMFGVYNSPRARISMSLVVGSDIDMTESKQTMMF